MGKIKHGQTWDSGKMSRTYISWTSMKQRCYNKKHFHYDNYGGRGITVCNSWLNSFENFFKDMGERLGGMTLDRVDNTKGYCKENCKWSTYKEQANNKRNNIDEDRKKILKKTCSTNSTYLNRKRLGWSIEEMKNNKHRPNIGERSSHETNYKKLKIHIMEQFKRNADIVKAYLGTLGEREKKIIEMRLGLVSGKRNTLEEVGKEFGVSRERIRQIEEKALKKISVLESEIKADIMV